MTWKSQRQEIWNKKDWNISILDEECHAQAISSTTDIQQY